MTPTLLAQNITKTFNYPAKIEILKGINLEIFPGDSIAIMGRSGEGKSTLLQILGTLDQPTAGKLFIKGLPAFKNVDKIRNQYIGFVFQSFHLLEDFSAIDNVMMPAKIARKDSKNSYARAKFLLEKVGLQDRLHYFAKQLSGGERQRVSIARAFFNDPDLLMADEPTGNLDRTTAASIQKLLLDFAHEEKKALLIVTHDPELASQCKKSLFLDEGILTFS